MASLGPTYCRVEEHLLCQRPLPVGKRKTLARRFACQSRPASALDRPHPKKQKCDRKWCVAVRTVQVRCVYPIWTHFKTHIGQPTLVAGGGGTWTILNLGCGGGYSTKTKKPTSTLIGPPRREHCSCRKVQRVCRVYGWLKQKEPGERDVAGIRIVGKLSSELRIRDGEGAAMQYRQHFSPIRREGQACIIDRVRRDVISRFGNTDAISAIGKLPN